MHQIVVITDDGNILPLLYSMKIYIDTCNKFVELLPKLMSQKLDGDLRLREQSLMVSKIIHLWEQALMVSK